MNDETIKDEDTVLSPIMVKKGTLYECSGDFSMCNTRFCIQTEMDIMRIFCREGKSCDKATLITGVLFFSIPQRGSI
jgi:hypothetical protein